jgi:hypothetical protein
MSIRVLAEQKPDADLPDKSDGSAQPLDQDKAPARRRRHTPEHHQDRFLRIFSRILMVMGGLMILWLLMRAFGWI